ncbi:Phosphoglycolate phosphatase [compost metagenome]
MVGVRKPDPAIWQLGVEAQGFLPHECVAVGDSYSKDILPAKATGAKAIWLNVAGFEETAETQASVADAEITDFAQVVDTIENLG